MNRCLHEFKACHGVVLFMIASAWSAWGGEVRFEKIVIDADHKCEAAGVADVNRSGHLSIICGEDWFEPTDRSLRHWRKHPLRKIQYTMEYFDDFGNLILDVNGDGWPDVVSGGWFNKSLNWYENPGQAGGPWKEHLIDSPGSVETVRLWDVTGEGRPAVVPDLPGGPLLWYELKRDAAGKGTGEFIKHEAAPKGFAGAGLGFGDVNGDGRGDFIASGGWLEAPADRRAGQWILHKEFNLGETGIPIFTCDVSGDGRADLIYGHGHDYGLYWLEQKAGPDGSRQWVRHVIDRRWSQAHAMALADLDGDGRPELVTGKRYRAHGDGDPGGKDPCCLYYYSIQKDGTFTRHVIDEGNKVGCGIDTIITDFNGDGRPDIICPGKGGLYLFLNQGVGEAPVAKAPSAQETKLLGLLKSQAPLDEKMAACRELARIGTSEAVMVLADLLPDPQPSHMARYALEGIPGGAAEAALRDALTEVKGPLLAGVIGSIAARGERWAGNDLIAFLRDPDPLVVREAALAVGRIASPLGIKYLQDTMTRAKEKDRPPYMAGLLAAADTLSARGQAKAAVPIYDALRTAKIAPRDREIAWRGAILARKGEGLPLLLEALRGSDPEAFRAGLRALEEMPDPKVARALAEELEKLPAEKQATLCPALGRRKDASTLPVVLRLAGSPAKPVRLAAIGAAGQIGNAAAITPLLELLKDDDAEIVDAARAALAGLPEAKVNAQVLALLGRANAPGRSAGIKLAGERRITQAIPALVKAIADADPAIRKVAIESYGQVAGSDELPRVLGMLGAAPNAAERAAFEKVLIAICGLADNQAGLVSKLAAAMEGANLEARAALLRAVGVVGNNPALEVVRAATTAPQPELRLEAIRLLSTWKTEAAAPLLLSLAKTADQPTAKVLAIRGYLGLGIRKDFPFETRARICREGAPLANQTDQKRLLLAGMNSAADPRLIDLIVPILDDPAVHREATATLLNLAKRAGKGQAATARRALEKLITVAANEPATVEQVREMLKKIDALK